MIELLLFLCFAAHTLPATHPHHHQQLYVQICGCQKVRHSLFYFILLTYYSFYFIVLFSFTLIDFSV